MTTEPLFCLSPFHAIRLSDVAEVGVEDCTPFDEDGDRIFRETKTVWLRMSRESERFYVWDSRALDLLAKLGALDLYKEFEDYLAKTTKETK